MICNVTMMKRNILMALAVAWLCCTAAHAVLKEANLDNTLSILRVELMDHYKELDRHTGLMKEQQQRVFSELMTIMNRSNQNSLMLYSQKPEYIFDLTYACHEATEQYAKFQQNVLPFRTFVDRTDGEIARYDSLIVNLSQMDANGLSPKAKIDRNVCMTLAVSIRRTLKENNEQLTHYINIYKNTEEHLSALNDYANKCYKEIQSNIFKNGGQNYLTILANLQSEVRSTTNVVAGKYRTMRNVRSQWDSSIILILYTLILAYAFIAILSNYVLMRFLFPRRWRSEGFMEKRTCITLTTSVVTFAILLGLSKLIFRDQNFILMASSLLVEYAWLLGVILVSLLIRLDGKQIKNAFRIYAPLIFIGFVVITFRIVLIPSDLVNLIFPPLLLACLVWQWIAIRHNNHNIPRSDVFYTYISLTVFIASTICSWTGYTLLSVQLLIWWVMQLTCILTITCIQGLLKNWAQKRGYDKRPVTETWFYQFVHQVVLPVMGVFSVLVSIYWAADVFNLSATTWEIFRTRFIDSKNFTVSLFSIAQLFTLYFVFAYINKTVKALLKMYFDRTDKSTAASRMVMTKNVLQVVVWGIWLLIGLSILHVSNTWLVVVSGGLSTGIGFAMKDILENIYYGISLMAGRIKVGDWIICDGIKGKVSSISYTSTLIEAIDGSVIAFTNSQLFTKNYKNMTKNHGYQMETLAVGVAYGTNVAEVKELLAEAITGLDCVYKKRPVRIVLKEFGDSSVNLNIYVWLSVLSQVVDRGTVLECIYNTLNENHVEIPFPQRDIHMKN